MSLQLPNLIIIIIIFNYHAFINDIIDMYPKISHKKR